MKLCTNVNEVKEMDGYFKIITNSIEIRVHFLTDTILRIRAGFDGDFAEESYSLVMTAWEDRMDGLLKGQRKRVVPATASLSQTGEQVILTGSQLKVVIEKEYPFKNALDALKKTETRRARGKLVVKINQEQR